MSAYLGIDCGSVSVKIALVEGDRVTFKLYRKNTGLISSIQEGLRQLPLADIAGVGVTGSGKEFVRTMLVADYVDSEIIAHMVAALREYPEARTILDVGGEDSKLMLVRDGTLVNFQMNKDCVLPTDKVTTEEFLPKQIKDIKVGDKVLTHEGRFRKVQHIIKRHHQGLIYKINCGGSNNLNVTENHPVLALKRNQIKCFTSRTRNIQVCNQANECHKRCIKKDRIDFEPKFLTPDVLTKGDYLNLTTPKLDLAISRNGYDPEFLRLCGYFLAEGNIEYNKPRVKRDNGVKRATGLKYESGVALCFNITERQYIQDTLQTLTHLGLRPKFKPSPHNRAIIKVHNSEFAKKMKDLCGEYSNNKEIKPQLMQIDSRSLLHITRGIFRGDGHLAITDRKRSLTLKTTSPNLASQVSYILLTNNIKNTITTSSTTNRKEVYMVSINGLEINKLRDYPIIIAKRKLHPRKSSYGFLVPIRSIKKQLYNGDVYNLTVEGDNSYVCNHLAVHNCGGGTGAMIESIASRLGVTVEQVGPLALESTRPASLPGKCGIFCQSAVVSELNRGRHISDILMGVCRALVGNYLAVLGKGKTLHGPIVFQGATAQNRALVRCFEQALGSPVLVPSDCPYMGAIGIAHLARDHMDGAGSSFPGSDAIINSRFDTQVTSCDDCQNSCDLLHLYRNGRLAAVSGSRCGKYNL